MDSVAATDTTSLPAYLQQVFSSLPPDQRTVLGNPNGPCLADIQDLVKEDRENAFAYLLLARHRVTERLAERPGPSPELILERAEIYAALGYSELALADAYISYTLCLVTLDGPDISDPVPIDSNGEP